MLYLTELFTFLFAYAIARHDVPAVDNFTYYGSTTKHQSMFHGSGFLTKLFYLANITTIVYLTKGILPSVYVLLCSALIIWVVFDPVIAITRTVYTPPKKPWYYLSEKSNFIDRSLIKAFGNKAGLYKFWFCVVLLLAINVFQWLSKK